MKGKKSWLVPVLLSIIAILIHLLSSNKLWVDKYYVNGAYPYISATLKFLLGWLPFSLGDILYGACGAWLLIMIVKIIIRVFQRRVSTEGFIKAFTRLITAALWIYVIFNLLWGINYNRSGIASQVGIKLEKYSVQDLLTVDSLLLLKVNSSRLIIGNNHLVTTTAGIRSKTITAYEEITKKYSFLNAQPISIKPSLWGWLGNYIGFIGYYNPFTGEAQVNTTVPQFIQPFTFCHETAHQLGYAKENEANFVGYLAASASPDTGFHYSVYLDLFLYAQHNLYFADSAAAKLLAKSMLPAVKADLATLRKFNELHKNPVEPAIRWLYGKYLESNQQPSGVLSYDEVVGFLIAYYKKFGEI